MDEYGWKSPRQNPSSMSSSSSDQSIEGMPFGTNLQIVRKLTPTVLHNAKLNAFNDAEVLHKEMHSIEINKERMISILSKCNNQHRQDTASTFNKLYKKDLMKELESKIVNFNAWKLKDLNAAMMTPIVDYYAEEVHSCISETHADKDVLIMILCTLKNQDIHRVRVRYGKKYGKSMETDISGDRPGRFERLMVSLCRGERDESALTDIDAAEIDARRLYNVKLCHLGTHEPEFNFIFTRRNVHQLRLIFKKYSRLYGHDISQDINREFSGHMKTALLTIVKVAKNSALYFAEQLNDAMSGIGTRDQKLIFICVTRSEIDMGDIRRAFCKQYRKKLKKHISENTSGDYQNCLIKLINSNSTILETIYAWPYSIFQSILYFFVLINLLDRLFIFIQYRTPNENIASFLYTRNEKTWI